MIGYFTYFFTNLNKNYERKYNFIKLQINIGTQNTILSFKEFSNNHKKTK